MNPYPVVVAFEEDYRDRKRVTVLFRLVLATPHMLLIGGGLGSLALLIDRLVSEQAGPVGSSVLGGSVSAAATSAGLICWFAILFTGRMPDGLWRFIAYIARWQLRYTAYMAFLTDRYPPLGEPESASRYPAFMAVETPGEPRNRLTTAFRIILAIPHFFLLFFLGAAAFFVAIISWFAIVFAGRIPEWAFNFSAGTIAWSTRVGGYTSLLVDEYPPFSLDWQRIRPPEAIPAPPPSMYPPANPAFDYVT
jgi:hypothetical protein